MEDRMLPRILSRNQCYAKNRPMIRLWSSIHRNRAILPRFGAGVGAAEIFYILGARVGVGDGVVMLLRSLSWSVQDSAALIVI